MWPDRRDGHAAQLASARGVAGVDEAGRGPWAGPVVAAAVLLPDGASLPVRIDDSKRLTPRQRARAFDVILRHAEVGFGVVCASEIDRRNILQATLVAMQQAVRDLPTPPDAVLVDGATAPPLDVPCYPMVHGDRRSYAIACASIMAKVVRDRLMALYHELDPRYAFDRHKGYGTRLHAQQLARWGVSLFHRRSFRPVRDVLIREVAGPATEAGYPRRGWPTGVPAAAGARPAASPATTTVVADDTSTTTPRATG